MKPAFTQLPKMNSAFTKMPTLSTLKANFIKISPLNIKSAFTSLPNSSFKFTKLPELQAPRFVPYSFNVAKVTPAKTATMDIKSAAQNYNVAQNSSVPRSSVATLSTNYVPVNSGRLIAVASAVNQTTIETITPVNIESKLKVIAMLPSGQDSEETIVTRRTQTLENYLASTNVPTYQVSPKEALAQLQSANIEKQALLGLMQQTAPKVEALRVTVQYNSPAEMYLQSYAVMPQ
ncbi:MAG: hypothetical protein WCI77_10775 [Candidatus Omnitrophota bacterium]